MNHHAKITAALPALWALALVVASCQPQPQDTTPAGTQQYQQAPTQASAQPTSSAVSSSSSATIIGTWGNSQMGMMFQLAPNGAYVMQAQGNQVSGTWAVPQAGVIVFTANGAPTNYRYSLQNGQLGLQDPQGQVMWFAPVQAAPQQTTPVATTGLRGGAHQPLPYPQRYRGYNAPVLAYLAETLSKQTPQNVARGLRSLSAVGHQLLGLQPAFAEQLHWMGCQADASLILYNAQAAGRSPQNCAATQASWQSTYQLSNGSVTPANCDQCNSQILTTVIGFQCTVGLMSKGDCQAAMQQMQSQNNMNHETMTRIINNMPGGNSCVCGDPNCSC